MKNVLGNTSYSDVDVTELNQIVSFMELHVASDGKFKHQPSWIMSQVALAIGIQEMEVVTIRREWLIFYQHLGNVATTVPQVT